MNENVSYVSPEVEVVKIAIEKGFAASPGEDFDNNGLNGDQGGVLPQPFPGEED